MSDRRPLLATGEFVEDYSPLFYYIETAAELGKYEAKESILIRNADLEKVKELVSSSRFSLAQLVDSLMEYVRNRIDPEVAVSALIKYLNHQVTEDYAIKFYSRLISLWIIEAASSLNIIRLKSRS
ncbi:MAG: hypothetical protein QXO98_03160 [Sulfolobales archaeon]